MRSQISIDEVISFLNELITLDRQALFQLMTHRITCNESLAQHPTVQVRDVGGSSIVGMLGILNGMFGVDSSGWGPITMVVDFENPERVSFRRTPENPPSKAS